MPRKKNDLHRCLAVLDEATMLLEEHAAKLKRANDAVALEVRRAQALLGGTVAVQNAPTALPSTSAPPLTLRRVPTLAAEGEDPALQAAEAQARQRGGGAPTVAQLQEQAQREFLAERRQEIKIRAASMRGDPREGSAVMEDIDG